MANYDAQPIHRKKEEEKSEFKKNYRKKKLQSITILYEIPKPNIIMKTLLSMP